LLTFSDILLFAQNAYVQIISFSTNFLFVSGARGSLVRGAAMCTIDYWPAQRPQPQTRRCTPRINITSVMMWSKASRQPASSPPEQPPHRQNQDLFLLGQWTEYIVGIIPQSRINKKKRIHFSLRVIVILDVCRQFWHEFSRQFWHEMFWDELLLSHQRVADLLTWLRNRWFSIRLPSRKSDEWFGLKTNEITRWKFRILIGVRLKKNDAPTIICIWRSVLKFCKLQFVRWTSLATTTA